jgi:hypothetical protein
VIPYLGDTALEIHQQRIGRQQSDVGDDGIGAPSGGSGRRLGREIN